MKAVGEQAIVRSEVDGSFAVAVYFVHALVLLPVWAFEFKLEVSELRAVKQADTVVCSHPDKIPFILVYGMDDVAWQSVFHHIMPELRGLVHCGYWHGGAKEGHSDYPDSFDESYHKY